MLLFKYQTRGLASVKFITVYQVTSQFKSSDRKTKSEKLSNKKET